MPHRTGSPDDRIWHCRSCSTPSTIVVLGVFLFRFGFFSFSVWVRFGFFVARWRRRVFKLYAFKKRLRINWIISFFLVWVAYSLGFLQLPSVF